MPKITKINETDLKRNIEQVPVDLCRCQVCGYEGEYQVDVVDTGCLTIDGHDSLMLACKDVSACLDQRDAQLSKWSKLWHKPIIYCEKPKCGGAYIGGECHLCGQPLRKQERKDYERI